MLGLGVLVARACDLSCCDERESTSGPPLETLAGLQMKKGRSESKKAQEGDAKTEPQVQYGLNGALETLRRNSTGPAGSCDLSEPTTSPEDNSQLSRETGTVQGKDVSSTTNTNENVVVENIVPGTLDSLNQSLSEVQTKYLSSPKKDRRALKSQYLEEVAALEGQIKEIHELHVNRPPCNAGAVEYTWKKQGPLGLRFMEASGPGAIVKYIAPDAPADLPDVVGMAMVSANGIPCRDAAFEDITRAIRDAPRPITIRFEATKATKGEALSFWPDSTGFAREQAGHWK